MLIKANNIRNEEEFEFELDDTEPNTIFNMRQFCAILGISYQSMNQHKKRGNFKVPYFMMGRRIYYLKKDIVAYIRASMVNPGEKNDESTTAV